MLEEKTDLSHMMPLYTLNNFVFEQQTENRTFDSYIACLHSRRLPPGKTLPVIRDWAW